MEIWKDILNYENIYQISNFGRVKSIERKLNTGNNFFRIKKENILKQQSNKRGYSTCILTKNNKIQGVLIHRLVAQAFLPNPKNKPQVNHINGIKSDNNISNLEWNTSSENNKHAHLNKLNNARKGSENSLSKIVLNLENGIYYDSLKEAAYYNNINYGTLKSAMRFKTKLNKKFTYVN
jgi:hypothetical protein